MRSRLRWELLVVTGLLSASWLGCFPEQTSQAAGSSPNKQRKVVQVRPTVPRVFHTPRYLAAASSSFLSSSSVEVRKAALRYPRRSEAGPRQAPISLTASDGTGLRLVSLKAKAAISGPLAFTQLHLTFKNPKPRTIEGRFSITLPDGAAISRFAMRLRSGWQEAEMVERQQAREVYESFLHRKQDPALLEKKAGNAFRARVFPIPGRGIKELLVSYSQQLSSTRRPYKIHLKGLPKIDLLEIEAQLGRRTIRRGHASLGGSLVSRQAVRVTKHRYKPDQDFEVPMLRQIHGLRHDNLVVARIRPSLPDRQLPLDGLLVLVDTSASRAAGFSAQVEVLGALVRSLASRHGESLPLQVACFDQTVARVYAGPAGKLTRQHLDHILARRALGASNLAGALGWARRHARAKRMLLVTDGVVTAGTRSGAHLRRAVSRLKSRVSRLDVLLVGGIRDEALMGRLVRGTLGQDGVVLEGDLPTDEIARRLGQAAISGIEVQVPGARWVWPSVLDGVQPGQEVLVYADLSNSKAAPTQGKPLIVKLSGAVSQSLQLPLTPAERPLLERALIKARIDRLEHRRDTFGDGSQRQAAKVRKKIVALSTRYRVMSDHTALLVLETEWDYRRFGLDRKALADILIVGSDGVDVLKRSKRRRRTAIRSASAGTDTRDALGGLIGNQIGESYGVGGLGVVGTGRGGGGTGEGTIGLGTLGTIGKGGGGGTGAGYGRGVGRLRGIGPVLGRRHRGEEGKIGSSRRRGRRSGLFGLRGPRGEEQPQWLRRRGPTTSSSTVGRARSGRLAGRRARAPRVIAGRAEVRGSLDKEIIRRIIRRHINEVRYCYQVELQANPALTGRVAVRFSINPSGQVMASQVSSSTLGNTRVETCVARAVRRWLFPKPRGGGVVIVTYPFVFRQAGAAPPVKALAGVPRSVSPAVVRPVKPVKKEELDRRRFGRIRALLKKHRHEAALVQALRWRSEEPGSVLALISLGEALKAKGQRELAARAFGSIIDLYPSRADMRRFAGAELEALGKAGLSLAVDTYSKAQRQRPDHPTVYRLLAIGLMRQGKVAKAFRTLELGLRRRYPSGRFAGFQQVLREDLGMIGAAWLAKEPGRRPEVMHRLAKAGSALAARPSLRFVLNWETDANDVDLHLHDGRGGHAYYRKPRLRSGGVLHHDVTTGYGPECFSIYGKARAFPYRLRVHYYARGPMGYGMGRVQVVDHDGAGGLRFEDRPFVVLEDGAFVDLGRLKGPLGS